MTAAEEPRENSLRMKDRTRRYLPAVESVILPPEIDEPDDPQSGRSASV